MVAKTGIRLFKPLICRIFATSGCGAMRAERHPCRIGVVGDLDEGAEPTGIAEGQAGQIEQQQAGRAVDGCVALPDKAIAGNDIQLCWHAQDLDPCAALGRRLVLALGHRRLQSVLLSVDAIPAYGRTTAYLGVQGRRTRPG